MLKRLGLLLADHGRDVAGVVVVIAIAASLVFVLGRASTKSGRGCAAAYAHALNAADSARVDAQPVPGTIRVGRTCGRLRTRGELPRETAGR